MLSLLIVEGGLTTVDVKLMRHISSDLSAAIKQQMSAQPLLFINKYNYFLKDFEKSTGFTVLNYKYGYSTPADLISAGRIVEYDCRIVDSPRNISALKNIFDFKTYFCIERISGSDDDSKFLHAVEMVNGYLRMRQKTPTEIVKIIMDDIGRSNDPKKLYENCLLTLLNYGYEELAANILIAAWRIFIDDSRVFLFYAIRCGYFKFISMSMKWSDDLTGFNQSYFDNGCDGDLYQNTFVDNAAAIDFYCKIVMKKQPTQSIDNHLKTGFVLPFGKSAPAAQMSGAPYDNRMCFIPIELFYGIGNRNCIVNSSKYTSFIHNIINNSSDEILYYLYVRSSSSMLLSFDNIKSIKIDDSIDYFMRKVFSDVFTEADNHRKGRSPLQTPYDNHGFTMLPGPKGQDNHKILFLAALQDRQTFIGEVLKIHRPLSQENMEKTCIDIGRDKLLINMSPFHQKIYIVILAALNQGNISLLYHISEIENAAKIIKEFFDIIFTVAWSDNMSPVLIADNYDGKEITPPRILSFNLARFLNKKLSYKLSINICKSGYNGFISKWNLLFFYGLKCECGGLYHRNMEWNMPPGR